MYLLQVLVCGHTMGNTLYLIRTAKLSPLRHAQYSGGGPRGNRMCCRLFFCSLLPFVVLHPEAARLPVLIGTSQMWLVSRVYSSTQVLCLCSTRPGGLVVTCQPKQIRFRKSRRSYLDQNLLIVTNPVSDLTAGTSSSM